MSETKVRLYVPICLNTDVTPRPRLITWYAFFYKWMKTSLEFKCFYLSNQSPIDRIRNWKETVSYHLCKFSKPDQVQDVCYRNEKWNYKMNDSLGPWSKYIIQIFVSSAEVMKNVRRSDYLAWTEITFN